jgi:hypothetical protein
MISCDGGFGRENMKMSNCEVGCFWMPEPAVHFVHLMQLYAVASMYIKMRNYVIFGRQPVFEKIQFKYTRLIPPRWYRCLVQKNAFAVDFCAQCSTSDIIHVGLLVCF